MIRFSCPSCSTSLSAPEEKAGHKVNCRRCGQRLQIPQPALNKTILGNLLPPSTSQNPVPQSPPESWYYLRDGQKQGPLTWSQLQQLAATGKLGPADQVWTQKMVQWVSASTVKDLIPVPGQIALNPSPPRTSQPLSIPPAAAPPPRLPAPAAHRPYPVVLLAGGALATVAAIAIVVLVVFLNRQKSTSASTDGESPSASTEEKELTVEQVAERNKPSVALVRGSFSTGTGFLIQDGFLVTNSHVIDNELLDKIQVYFPSVGEEGKKPTPAELVYEDRKRDLAVLKITTKLPGLKVAEGFKWKAGEKIIIIGSPGALAGEEVTLENAVTPGTMSTETTLNGLKFYQLYAPVNPGNSGGPVFNSRGRVVGVVTRKAVGARQEGMGFAIPLADLQSALRRIETLSKEEIQKENSLHNMVTMFRRVARGGKLHGALMLVCSDRMDRAVRSGRTAQQGFDEGRNSLNDRFKQELAASERLITDLRPSIPRIISDSRLSSTMRNNLDRLLSTYTEMKNCLDKPRSSDYFIRKTRELVSDYEHQVDALKTLTGVENLD